jgi:hypothetical protein
VNSFDRVILLELIFVFRFTARALARGGRIRFIAGTGLVKRRELDLAVLFLGQYLDLLLRLVQDRRAECREFHAFFIVL